MKKFTVEITRSEIIEYTVQARNRSEAIEKVLDERGTLVDINTQCEEVLDCYETNPRKRKTT